MVVSATGPRAANELGGPVIPGSVERVFASIWVESGMIIKLYGLALSYWSIKKGDQVVNHVYTSDHVVILGAAMCLIWTYWYSPLQRTQDVQSMLV